MRTPADSHLKRGRGLAPQAREREPPSRVWGEQGGGDVACHRRQTKRMRNPADSRLERGRGVSTTENPSVSRLERGRGVSTKKRTENPSVSHLERGRGCRQERDNPSTSRWSEGGGCRQPRTPPSRAWSEGGVTWHLKPSFGTREGRS